MDTNGKRILLNIAYFATEMLTMIFCVLFMITMTMRGVATYQQVVYYIWSILLILTIVLDIIALKIHSLKFIVGLIIAGIALLCLVMGVIVYAGMNTGGVIPYFAGERFAIVIAFSVSLTILSIVVFCIGQHLIELKNSNVKKGR